MYRKYDLNPADLDASLKRLGIRELEERMEVAPLLADMGGAGGEEVIDNDFLEVCCVCKIGEPEEIIGNLPYPTIDPGPGLSTGPTNPGWKEIG